MQQHKFTVKATTQGFTLVELVLVIVLLGIISVGVSGFIKLSTQTYINVSERDELISSARFVIERLNREIRNAVPNSIRVKPGIAGPNYGFQCIEFVPILASTTYIDIPVAPESPSNSINVIPFLSQDGNSEYECTASCLDMVSIYPLAPDDVYANVSLVPNKLAGLQSVTKPLGSTLWTLTLDQALTFSAESPTKRLYIVKSPVSYCAIAGRLIRYDNYFISANFYIVPVGGALMAEHLAAYDHSQQPFIVEPATLQRNATVQVRLHFQRNNEDLVFNHEIQVKNVP